MADILIRLNGIDDISAKEHEIVERISIGPQPVCQIHGKEGTFCLVRNGEDAIASIGYVCRLDGDSVQATLSQILSSFDESQIGELKKKLVGQYVLLIKRKDNIFLFSDFMGVRNIFYSNDGKVISSSYSNVENILGMSETDLDIYKVYEFLAMRHVCYPSWLDHSTENRQINWLLPYEYLVIDGKSSSFRIGSIVYNIDNKKQTDCSLLADELLSTLRAVIGRKELKYSSVAASLTGGRDSRLVATIAAEHFPNIHYRIAVASDTITSMKDFEVAEKIAKIQNIPLDVYHFKFGQDEEKFRELTEGFIPSYNHSITPLIDNAGAYSLGFGGAYGTELFTPIPWGTIENYVQQKIENAKRALKVVDGFWKYFRDAIHDEFQRTKDHYRLSNDDDRDYIRLFTLLSAARYSSFIMSAFNRTGYQFEPYGSYPVLNLALRVAPALWGNHRRFGGDALVQRTAMAKLDSDVARVMTFYSFRPMSPLTITSAPYYLIGFTLQVANWLRDKFVGLKNEPKRTDLPNGYYLSNGWETQFLERTMKKYGLPVKP